MAISIRLPIRITRKGKRFLASCSSLDVVTQGETQEEAKRNIAEALHLFFRSCIERGTLDAVLKQCGFTSISEYMGVIAPDEEQIDVPLYLLSSLPEAEHCHAQRRCPGKCLNASFSGPALSLKGRKAAIGVITKRDACVQ